MPRPAYSAEQRENLEKNILDQAAELFAKQGLRNVSMRNIASSLGWTATTLYRYYKNKDALIAAIRVKGFQQMEEILAESRQAGDGVAVINAAMTAYLHFATDQPHMFRLLYELDQGEVTEHPTVVVARQSAFSQAANIAQFLLDDLTLTGEPNETAHLMWIAGHGLATLALANQLDLGKNIDDLTMPVTKMFLHGIGYKGEH